MDITELKNILDSVAPERIVESSKEIEQHLNKSVENQKRFHDSVVLILDKVKEIKKTINFDISELEIQRSKIISESNQSFNERTDRIKILEAQIIKKQSDLSSLEESIKEASNRMNNVHKNLEAVIMEKNKAAEDLANTEGRIHSLKMKEIELSNVIASAEVKKNNSIKDLSEVQSKVEEANKILQFKNNEILILQERIKSN